MMQNLNNLLEQNSKRLIIWSTIMNDENLTCCSNMAIVFSDMITCENIEDLIQIIKREKDKSILLIVSGSRGRELKSLKDSSNNDLNVLLSPNIHKIYVFCGDVNAQRSWTSDIKEKVSIVSTKYSEIEDKLIQDAIELIPKEPGQKKDRLIVWYFQNLNENKGYFKKMEAKFPNEEFEMYDNLEFLKEKIQLEKERNIFLVTSGRHGRELKNQMNRDNSDINPLSSSNVHKIYIFCGKVEEQSDWIADITKISLVATKYHEIESKIEKDLNENSEPQAQRIQQEEQLNDLTYMEPSINQSLDRDLSHSNLKKIQQVLVNPNLYEDKNNSIKVSYNNQYCKSENLNDISHSSLISQLNIIPGTSIIDNNFNIVNKQDTTFSIAESIIIDKKFDFNQNDQQSSLGHTIYEDENQSVNSCETNNSKLQSSKVCNNLIIQRENDKNQIKSEAEKYLEECDNLSFPENMLRGPLSSSHGLMPKNHPIYKFSDAGTNSTIQNIINSLPDWWNNNEVKERIDEIYLNVRNIRYTKEETPLLVLILGHVANAYYHNQNYVNQGERKLPNHDFMELWEECSRKMDRQQSLNLRDKDTKQLTLTKETIKFPFLSYNDIFNCNFKLSNCEGGDAYDFKQINIDEGNINLLIHTLNSDKNAEVNFIKAHIEIGIKSAPLVKYAARAQTKMLNNFDKEICEDIKKMIKTLRKVIESYKKIVPYESCSRISPNSSKIKGIGNNLNSRVVDPIEWSRGAARLATTIREFIEEEDNDGVKSEYGKIQGATGYISPFTRILDIFLGLDSDNLSEAASSYISSFPKLWLEFFDNLKKFNVREYINKSLDDNLKSIFFELESLHKSWIQTHTLKLYTYLEPHFKTETEFMINSNFELTKKNIDRDWNKHLESLTFSNRIAQENYFKNTLKVKSIKISSTNQAEIEFERPEDRFRYTVGDHVAILPENSKEEIDKILEILDCDGSEKFACDDYAESTKLWQEHFKYRFRKSSENNSLYENYSLKNATLRDILKFGRIRNVSSIQAKILNILVPNDYLRKYSQDKLYLAKLDLKYILQKCKNLVGTHPSFRDRILYPEEEFKLQLYSGILDLIQPEEFRYYSIASSKNSNILKIIVSRLEYEVKVSEDQLGSQGEQKIIQKGTCSNYLFNLNENDEVSLKIIHNPLLRLPSGSDIKCPILMIASEVGISPFISFINQRKKHNLTKNYLYYSAKNKESCYFYDDLIKFKQQEAKALQTLKICFTNENGKNDDIHKYNSTMDQMLSDVSTRNMINSMIYKEHGYIYICGPNEFTLQVYNKILSIFESFYDNSNTHKAKERLNELIAAKRLCIDSFSSYKHLDDKKHLEISKVVKDESRCLTIIGDYVYDLTDYKTQHYGGANSIELYKGMDATERFNVINHSKSDQIVSQASLYIIAKVYQPKIAFPLKEIYNSWKEYLFSIVGLRNAWEKEILVYKTDGAISELSTFIDNEMILTHNKFFKFYLESIFSEKLFTLWSDIYKLIEKYFTNKETITEFSEESFRNRFSKIEKLNEFNLTKILPDMREKINNDSDYLLPLLGILKFERNLFRIFILDNVTKIVEGLELFERTNIKQPFNLYLPMLLRKLYQIINRLETFSHVILKLWNRNELSQNVDFFINLNEIEREVYCKGGLMFPENLRPAIIYTRQINNLTNSIKFNLENINGNNMYTYSINQDFLDSIDTDLKNKLNFTKNKFEECKSISSEFRNKFNLMIPHEAKSFIWAYQFDTNRNVNTNSIGKLYETYNELFKEDTEKGQIIRFALFGAFIFFSDDKKEKLNPQSIVGISTLNFPAEYKENVEFTGLILDNPVSYVAGTEIYSGMLNVTIPFLKQLGANKYKVNVDAENNVNETKNFEFIYQIEKGLLKKCVKFEALKIRTLKSISRNECLILGENCEEDRSEYYINY